MLRKEKKGWLCSVRESIPFHVVVTMSTASFCNCAGVQTEILNSLIMQSEYFYQHQVDIWIYLFFCLEFKFETKVRFVQNL